MLKPFPKKSETTLSRPGAATSRVAALALLGIAVLWAWYPILCTMVRRWSSDPQYSHGFLVPLIAGMIVWFRREDIPISETRPLPRGLIFVAAGVVGYLAGARIYFDWLQLVSLLTVLYGSVLVAGGASWGRIVLPAVLFLVFMIPLPYMAEVAMARPLQTVAGTASTYTLQTLGFVAVQRGNLIDIEGHVLGVAEACSGLRMLVVFFAFAFAVAILSSRSWLQKLILIVSAVPIALICNIGRITLTGALYVYAGPEIADRVFHDFAGWLMMPAALLLMWLELKYVTLVIDESGGTGFGDRQSAGVFGLSV